MTDGETDTGHSTTTLQSSSFDRGGKNKNQ